MSRIALLGAAALLAVACTGSLGPTALPTLPDLTQPTPAGTAAQPTALPATLPPTGDVPADLLNQLAEEASAVSGVPVGELIVDRAESVVWNDGSLGCPDPGEVYSQALVDGYWVVLRGGGQEFDFRASTAGEVKLCPPGQGRPPIQP